MKWDNQNIKNSAEDGTMSACLGTCISPIGPPLTLEEVPTGLVIWMPGLELSYGKWDQREVMAV